MAKSDKSKPTLHILSLEDSARDFELIQELMIDSGYQPEMTRVETGPDFEAALQQGAFDIVLADFNLPQYDAYSALEQTRQISPETPFLVVSGAVGEETAIELIKLGAVDYVLKDRPKRLISAIERALEEAQAIQARKQAEQALQENLALLKIAGEAARFGGWRVDLATNIVTWSDVVAEIHEMPHGYDPPVEEGINYYAPEWREKITEVYTRCAREGVPYDEEMQILTSSGRRVWVRVIGEAVRDEAGEITIVHGAFQDITEKVRIREHQRQSDAMFTSSFMHAASGMVLIGKEGQYIRVNQAFCDLLGYTVEELLELSFQDVTHPEDLEPDLEYLRKLTAKEITTFQIKKRYLTKTGETVWALISVSTIHDAQGEPEFFIIQINDITDQKKAEQALQESEALFSSAFENAAVGMNIADLQGRYLRVNQVLCKMYGYSQDELLKMAFEDLTHPEDLAADSALFMQLLNGELDTYQLEKRFIRKDGGILWAQISVSLVRDSDGEPLYSVAQIEDISERKRAEEALRESEALFSSAFENAAVGMNIVDLGGRYLRVNQAQCEMFGYSREALLKMTYQEVTYPEDLDADNALVERMMAGEINSFQMEKRYLRKDGSSMWAQISVSLVKDDDGTPLYTVSLVNDISEQKRAQQLLRDSEEKFRTLFNQSLFEIYLHDLDGHILEVNQQASTDSGYTPEELLGMSIFDLHPPQSEDVRPRDEILQIFRQWQPGVVKTLVSKHQRKDGSTYPIEVNAGVVQINNEIYILAICADITERLEAQQKIAEFEAQLRALFENMNDVVFTMNKDGVIEYFAPTRYSLLYAPAEEQTGRPIHETLPTDSADYQLGLARQALESGEDVLGEYSLEIKGQEIWFACTVSPITADTVLWIAHDITERKNAERKLAESEAELRALFAGMESVVIVMDKDGRYLRFAPTKETLLVGDPDDQVGKTCHEVLPQAQADFQLETVRTALDTGQVVRGEYALSIDGNEVWFAATASPLTGDTVLWLAHDITDRKQAEVELQQRESLLEKIFEVLPVGLWFANEEGTLLRGNPAGVRIWGGEPKVGMEAYGVFKARRLPSGEEVAPEDWALGRTIRERVAVTDELLEIDAFDGEKRIILNFTVPVEDDKDKLLGAIVVNHDITKQQLAEQALRESEIYIRTVLDNLPIGLAVNTVESPLEFSYINDNFIKLYRTTREALLQPDNFWDAVYPDPAFREEIKQQVLDDYASGDPEQMVWEDVPITRPGEETTYVSAKNTPLPGQDQVISAVWDTTSRVRAEQALRASEQRYRELVINLPGVVYICQNDRDYSMSYITANIEDLTGIPAERFTSHELSIVALHHPDDLEKIYSDIDTAVANQQPYHLEYRIMHTDGEYRWAQEWGAGVFQDGQLQYLEGFIIDVSEQKELELALVESEHIFQIALKNSPIMVFQMDRELRYTKLYNPHKDYSLTNQIGKTDFDRFSPEDAAKLTEIKQRVLDSGKAERVLLETSSDQLAQFIDMTVEPTFNPEGEIVGITCASVDVTDFRLADEERLRRLAELEALIQITHLLDTARSRDEALPILLNETLSVLGLDSGSIHLYDSTTEKLEMVAVSGWFEDLTVNAIEPGRGIVGQVYASGKEHLSDEFLSDPQTAQNEVHQIPAGWGGAAVPIQAGQETIGVFMISWQQPYQVDPFNIQLLQTIARMAGITLHRMNLLEDALGRLEKIKAQRTIDKAITSLTDISMTLDIICAQALERLPADAVGVLLYTPHDQALTHAAGAGFKTDGYRQSRLRLGIGDVGQAALDQRTLHRDDLANLDPPFQRHELFANEAFNCYTGIPLVSKGELKGMLEIFHASHFHHSQEWHNDVQTLASQTAVAIDTFQLYDQLRRNNLQLVQAYDATIEGWSLALDLRDHETEGHSLRVTDLTIQLARALGVSDDDLVHIRRGALMHDMGKLGVPDSILLKPGPLSDEEWAVMRQHPRLAYNMLSQISYLRPALDIPYSHHEKWDGTGYPNQLKGEQIPLAARIFAVIDVYDALTSDRPYRKAWSKEKALAHIKEQSGSHFDPRVVEVFLGMIGE